MDKYWCIVCCMKAECVGVFAMLILGLYEAHLLLHLLTKALNRTQVTQTCAWPWA